MGKPAKIPKALKGGTAFALDKHRRIVREMPVHVEKRMQDIAARNEILNSVEAYNARLERDRVTAALHNMPPTCYDTHTTLMLNHVFVSNMAH